MREKCKNKFNCKSDVNVTVEDLIVEVIATVRKLGVRLWNGLIWLRIQTISGINVRVSLDVRILLRSWLTRGAFGCFIDCNMQKRQANFAAKNWQRLFRNAELLLFRYILISLNFISVAENCLRSLMCP